MSWKRRPKPTTKDSITGQESKAETTVDADAKTSAESGDRFCPKCGVWYSKNDASHKGH